MPAASPAWKFCGWSTSRPPLRWPTVSTSAKNGIIAVYDLGGGTFDISILKLHDGIFEVLATNGDTHLGGDDIDNLLLRIALEDIQSEWGEDLSNDNEGVQRLRRAVIQAKEQLSFVPAAHIELEYHGKKYQREIKRELFDKLITPIVDRTLGPCRDCIKDAGVTVEQIDEVVMVGGSTRIPLVRCAVEALFRVQAAHRAESGRSGRARRGRAGRHSGGQCARQTAARRDAALARHRNHGRRGVQADSSQFHHSRQRHAKLSPPASTARPTC